MPQQKKTIGIVLPAFNESTMIAEVVRSLPKDIDGNPTKTIVINDGSADATAAEAKKAGAIVINHLINYGPGAATRTGIHYARQHGCDIVATIDADGQHRSQDLSAVVRAVLLGKADYVVGNRLGDVKGMIWYRLVGNVGLSMLTFLIFGAWITDSQSGLRALNSVAADTIKFHSNDYTFCSEMIWRAKQKKLRIAEVPIKAIYTDYSMGKGVQSNLNGPKIVGRMLKHRFMGFING